MANPGPATQGFPNVVAQLQTVNIPSRTLWPADQLTALSAFGNGSMSFQYLPVNAPMTASRMDVPFAFSVSSSAASNTYGLGVTAIGGLYTNLGSVGNASVSGSNSLSALTTGSVTASFSVASNSAGQTQLNGSAIRMISVPMNMTVFPGEYLVAYALSTATISTGAATTALNQTISVMGAAQIQTGQNIVMEFTNVTNASTNIYGGMGVHSVTQSAPLATYALSDIVQTGTSLSQANFAVLFRNA